jgi:hypothetical protein
MSTPVLPGACVRAIALFYPLPDSRRVNAIRRIRDCELVLVMTVTNW